MADAVKKNSSSPDQRLTQMPLAIAGSPAAKAMTRKQVHVFHPNGKHYVLDMSRHTAN